MDTTTIFAKVEDQEIIPNDKDKFWDTLEDLEGEDIVMEIGRQYGKRSNQQNKYYWGVVVKEIAEETGHSPKEIHKVLKQKFLPKMNVLGYDIVKSTTELSTQDFEEYLRKIREWAATGQGLGMYIPEPNETKFAYSQTESLYQTMLDDQQKNADNS